MRTGGWDDWAESTFLGGGILLDRERAMRVLRARDQAFDQLDQVGPVKSAWVNQSTGRGSPAIGK